MIVSLIRMSVLAMQSSVRASISEFISYAHTSVNEVRATAKNFGPLSLMGSYFNYLSWFIAWFVKGEPQVPAEWEALQLHHSKEFPWVHEAIWQSAWEETYGADPEDEQIREWATEAAEYCIPGQKIYTVHHKFMSDLILFCCLSVFPYTHLFY